jgi:hypothetical protein
MGNDDVVERGRMHLSNNTNTTKKPLVIVGRIPVVMRSQYIDIAVPTVVYTGFSSAHLWSGNATSSSHQNIVHNKLHSYMFEAYHITRAKARLHQVMFSRPHYVHIGPTFGVFLPRPQTTPKHCV